MKLHLCLDFDLTITKLHTGGVFRNLTLNDFIDADKTRQIIRECLDNNHYFSIVTYGNSKEMIEESIKLLGFTEAEISKIAIITGMGRNKNQHIQKAKDFHGTNGDSRTILCDDDLSNVYYAKEAGLAVIKSEHTKERLDSSHLQALLDILDRPYEVCKICADHASTHDYDYLLPGYAAETGLPGR